MKSRSMKGAAAGVALVTVAAMSATAVPQIFSDSDGFFTGSSTSEALAEVPDLPDEETIAAAKGDPDAQAKLREDLKEILEKSNQRLAQAEGRTLSSNEKVRELSEAAAEARREAETAAQQAELASEENERDQENAGEAVADMYRNGGLSTEEFMLGDEDALSANALNQQINDGLASEAGDSDANSNARSHLSDNEDAKADAAESAENKAEEAAEKEAAEERERQRLAEEEAERQAEQERQEQQRIAVVAAIQDSEEVDNDEASDIADELEDEGARQVFNEEVAGTTTASAETSPTNTEAASEAPVTPTEEAPAETESSPAEEPAQEEATPEQEPAQEETTPEQEPAQEETTPEQEPAQEETTPEQEPTQESAPTQESTPEPTQTTAPEPTQTATPEPASTPSSTPTPTQTQTPTPTQTATPTPTQTATTAAPEPTPTQTTPAAPPSGNMSAAVNWAVNKTNEPGTSYVWGGNGPKGYDCSGFTVAAFAQSGKSLPRVSSAQYAAAKQYVSLDNLQPGDLVFWSNNGQGSGVYHVAIYIGNGQIAHARNPSTGITITDLHYSPWGMLSVGGRY